MHILLNQLGPSSEGRYFGGNIISGTNTYNVCALRDGTITPSFHYYCFAVYGFYHHVKHFVCPDFTYNGGAQSGLLVFISPLFADAGLDFLI